MQAGSYVVAEWVLKVIDKGAALYTEILLYDCSLAQEIAALNWFLPCLVRLQLVLSEQRCHCLIGAKQCIREGHRLQNLYQLAQISVLQDREIIFMCSVKAQLLPVPSMVMCSLKKLRKKIEMRFVCRQGNCVFFMVSHPCNLHDRKAWLTIGVLWLLLLTLRL